MASTAAAPVSVQLLRLAVPLIPASGFSLATLQLASLSLPPPHTPSSSTGYSTHTLNQLFPSPPPSSSRFTSSRSLSREQLQQDARGQLAPAERVGPAKALLEEWLAQGRKEMKQTVLEVGGGDLGIREGLRTRVKYNVPVLGQLSQALGLLGASTTTPLSSPSALLPIPSPTPHLAHVARIAQDLAKAAGDESQGVDWYATRARLGTIYGLAELHLLGSPLHSGGEVEERVDATLQLVDRLLLESAKVKKGVADAELFATWVTRSWMGMGRSLGL